MAARSSGSTGCEWPAHHQPHLGGGVHHRETVSRSRFAAARRAEPFPVGVPAVPQHVRPAEHPLALFLDDLQWLDGASLELLEYLVTHSEVRHLLLAGAYRDNEVGAAHPFAQTLAAIRKAGARMQEIVLAPLGLDDIGRLVTDASHCKWDSAQPFAKLAHQKTGRNPFFVIQFLMALAEEGLLRLDPDAAAWSWDLDRIRAKGYTDSVVDLVLGKLKGLSGAAQTALRQLACLGNEVQFATLSLFSRNQKRAFTHRSWRPPARV
jgi:predicted ATPase